MWHSFVMTWAMAGFPAPAGPYNHMMNPSHSASPRIHLRILLRVWIRVLGWHLGGSNLSSELWKAPA